MEKKELTQKEKLVASLERKIKNKKSKIAKMEGEYRDAMKVEKEELEILTIQFNALKK